MRITILMLRTVSVLSILYFFIVLFYSGPKTSFLWFWIALALSLFSASFVLTYLMKYPSTFHNSLRLVIQYSVWIGLSIFLLAEGFLVAKSLQTPVPNADYVIILGAQVRGRTPSLTLNARINTAADYLLKNPNTKAICSGGQGDGEDVTEAYAIKRGLIARGVKEERILLEEHSTNTVENLTFSQSFIDDPNSSVVVVTSNFHTYRASRIAMKLGYKNLSLSSAHEFLFTTPQYYVREFFALVKDWICNNI
ncbi:YdcF family protein [Lachnoclostridium phytofermentans]|uniref:DUF218 domain-containing protein n=1 Tax=Lachnoclostridium phytofermentans (strain ATCC 700394 / DSM 18823 / ISDg) TaxID=357809 RepID=A9KKP8_LACP7|nr:YdcF family protein [Lachnoclostridium phytofermentans]ABX41219.1 protein of unknown function DUF218 [Lachnoclostridium phytofermentans ISDg]